MCEATENLRAVAFGSQLPTTATIRVERRRRTKVLGTRESSEDAKGTVPSLRLSVAGLAPRRPRLNPMRVYMGFMLDSVPLRFFSKHHHHSTNVPYSFVHRQRYITLATGRIFKKHTGKRKDSKTTDANNVSCSTNVTFLMPLQSNLSESR